jgi:hypothetical protein
MNADEINWLLQTTEDPKTAKRFVQAQYERARISHEVMANLAREQCYVAAQKRKIDIVFANASFVETQGNSRPHPRAFRHNLRYQRARYLFHRTLAFAFCCRCETGTLVSGASCSKGIAPREADICR